MKIARQIFLSLALHALIFASFFFVPTKKPNLEPVQIELKTASGEQDSSENQGVHPQLRGKIKRKSAKIKLSDFSLHAESWQFKQYVSESAKDTVADWRAMKSYTEINPLDDNKGLTVSDSRFVSSFYGEIDKSIWQSDFLSEYGHVGTVFLHLEVTPRGEIVNGSFLGHADDNILKVVAARAVRKALRNETNELVLPQRNMVVNARFTWASYDVCKTSQGIHNNYLSFCKYGENKKKSFSNAEKAGKYLGALKYGLGAGEEIQKYNREEHHRRTQFDPFEDFKRDPDYNLGG